MADEPTLGEALRLLDAVSRRLERLAEDMAKDRREIGLTYVPRELFNQMYRAHEKRLDDIEEDSEVKARSNAETRRQLLVGVLISVVTALIALIVAVYFGGPS